jgi:hypothetical protein
VRTIDPRGGAVNFYMRDKDFKDLKGIGLGIRMCIRYSPSLCEE